jgi:DNA-binding MarR family transcriptional regulator
MAARSKPAVFTRRQKAVWAGFLHAHAAITRALSEAMEREHGLTLNEFEVLLCLSDEPVRMRDLATRASLTPSGLTGLIDRLEGRGILRRCPCADDGRSYLVELTDEGRAVYEAAVDGHVRRVQDWFLARLSAEEHRVLADLWPRLAAPPRSGVHP